MKITYSKETKLFKLDTERNRVPEFLNRDELELLALLAKLAVAESLKNEQTQDEPNTPMVFTFCIRCESTNLKHLYYKDSTPIFSKAVCDNCGAEYAAQPVILRHR